MIRNYNQHAANERNFLSWIRTAISITAFGILIEKSDQWFKVSDSKTLPFIDDIIGLIFIALGTIILVASTMRLKKLGLLIESTENTDWDAQNHNFVFGYILAGISGVIFLIFLIYKLSP